MHRSKQQAVAFLLGAVLVGGVLGFSADRVVEHYAKKKQQAERWIDRPSFFDDLGLTPEQRRAWSVISDSINCRTMIVSAANWPALDSIRDRGNAQLRNVMTPEQLAKWDARRQSPGGRGGRGAAGRGDARTEPNGGRAGGEARTEAREGSSGQQPGQTTRRQRRAEELEACRTMLKEQTIQ